MAMYGGDPDRIAALAGVVDGVVTAVDEWNAGATAVMLESGHAADASVVASRLGSTGEWCRRWIGSLVARAGLLEHMAVIGIAGSAADQLSAWALGTGIDSRIADLAPPNPGPDPVVRERVRDPAGEKRDGESWGAWVRRLGLATVLAHLASDVSLPGPLRQELVAGLLARLLTSSGRRPDRTLEIATMVETHVTTPDAAAAFLDAVDPGLLPSFVELGGLGRFDTEARARFMAPFASVLALASRGDRLSIDLEAIVGGPEAGLWFLTGDFDLDFLLRALTLAVGAGDEWHGELGETVGAAADVAHVDGRVAILTRLAEFGPGVAPLVVGALAESGTLREYVSPRLRYPDDGAAAGRMIEWLALDEAASSADSMVEVMDAVAAFGGARGVLAGAAVMLAAHIGSLASGSFGAGIPPTMLRPALEARGPVHELLVAGFLRRVMADPARAGILFTSVTRVLAAALRDSIDPGDPGSVAVAFADAGRVLDQLGDAYFARRLESARLADWEATVLTGLLAAAIDVALGSGLAGGSLPWTADLALGGLISVVDGTWSTPRGGRPVPATSVEDVFVENLDLERGLVLHAGIVLAGELARAGLIELPASWHGGAGPPATPEQWATFLDELIANGFPAHEWFNHAAALGGFFDFDPHPAD